MSLMQGGCCLTQSVVRNCVDVVDFFKVIHVILHIFVHRRFAVPLWNIVNKQPIIAAAPSILRTKW